MESRKIVYCPPILPAFDRCIDEYAAAKRKGEVNPTVRKTMDSPSDPQSAVHVLELAEASTTRIQEIMDQYGILQDTRNIVRFSDVLDVSDAAQWSEKEIIDFIDQAIFQPALRQYLGYVDPANHPLKDQKQTFTIPLAQNLITYTTNIIRSANNIDQLLNSITWCDKQYQELLISFLLKIFSKMDRKLLLYAKAFVQSEKFIAASNHHPRARESSRDFDPESTGPICISS